MNLNKVDISLILNWIADIKCRIFYRATVQIVHNTWP